MGTRVEVESEVFVVRRLGRSEKVYAVMGVLRQKKVRHMESSPKITKRRWASSLLHEASERGEQVVAVLG